MLKELSPNNLKNDKWFLFKHLTSKILGSHASIKVKHARYNQVSRLLNKIRKR